MRRFAIRAALVAAALAGAAVAQGDNPFRPFDRGAFETYLTQKGLAAEQVEAFRREAGDGFAGAAADTALRALSTDYDRAVTLAESGDPRAALALTKLLAGGDDPYLRAHVRYHLGRVFLDGDDPEQAVDVFAAYLRNDRNRTPLDGEAMYFYGHALADIPSAANAVQALQAFLELFPDAPERYRSSAQQQIDELLGQNSALHDIADVMKGVERRIRKTDTGEETQRRQQDVMTQLEKIIEQMEELEKQSSGAPGGLGTPSAPASNSAAPPGPTRIGNLDRVPGVADRWAVLKDLDRDEVATDLQNQLPGHYRRMLEEYYKKLGAGGR